jgi:hypothetical protein
LWDLTGLPAIAFLPVAVAALLLIVFGALLPSRSAFGTLHGIPTTFVKEQPSSKFD